MSDNPLDFFKTKEKKTWKPPDNHSVSVDNTDDEWLSSLPHKEYLIPGKGPARFYTIGILARVLQRDPVTVRSWEHKGWLPQAAFRTPPPRGTQLPDKELQGRRLYSEAQLRFLYEAYKRFNLAEPNHADWAGFKRHIKQHYPN